MTSSERDALLEAFDSNWIAPVGPALNAFESELAKATGTEAAVALSSGTAGLHLACLLADVGPGDRVLMPTSTFVASANAVRYTGATPHFIDVDPETGNIDPELTCRTLDRLASNNELPKAVMTVDLYGNCAEHTEITLRCHEFGISVIEDAAEAIGANSPDGPAGSLGDFGVISTNGNKLVTTGGGGAIVGRAEDMDRARFLASQAREPEAFFEHHELGYGYRLSNLLAAVGSAQLDRLDQLVKATRSIHERYRRAFAPISGLSMIDIDTHGQGNGWLSVVLLDPDLHRSPSEVCMQLMAQNIEARHSWKPMHLQKLYRDAPMEGGHVAGQIFARGVCLPSGSNLSLEDQARVVDCFLAAISDQGADVDLNAFEAVTTD